VENKNYSWLLRFAGFLVVILSFTSVAWSVDNVTQDLSQFKKKSVKQSTINPDIITNDDKCSNAINSFKELGGLRKTYYPSVYCTNLGLGPGKYERQKHYICNRRTGELVELPGVYFITSGGNSLNGLIDVEELQVSINGYNYTNISGVYEKSGIYYKYIGNGKFSTVK